MLHIDELLTRLCEINGSDLHLKVGARPLARIHGQLIIQNDLDELSDDNIRELFLQITSEQQRESFTKDWELDFTYEAPDLGRFRFSAYIQRNSLCLVCRHVQSQIPTIEQLGLPEVCKRVALKDSGLVLICGPTGCGKSTTLAAMMEYMNNRICRNVITIEDPIEYVHEDKLCAFSQRQVGTDTQSFNIALRHALRQDPDVILMGEMRDLESISTTLTAAETGHLVLTTLHAPNAIQAIDRIIDIFPPYQQEQVRQQLSTTLCAVMFQQLIPRGDGSGRVAAVEVILESEAICNLIRTKKNYQIMNVMQSATDEGMQSLDQAIFKLYCDGTITRESAMTYCVDQEQLKERIESFDLGRNGANRDYASSTDDNRANASLRGYVKPKVLPLENEIKT